MAIEIVRFPIVKSDFPELCKRLPEGIYQNLKDNEWRLYEEDTSYN